MPPFAALFDEPDPAQSAGPSWFDRALLVLLVPTAIAEGLLRDPLPLRALQIGLALLTVGTLWFRRKRPFQALLFGFGIGVACTLLALALGLAEFGLHTSAVVLLLPYSLMRWARAREVVLGLFALALAYLASFAQGSLRDGVEAISAAVVLLFPAAIGTAVRFRAQAERRDREHVKMRERELLARELHDTVAHHASAIVIQARAARTVLERRPEAALTALHAIEGEASKALAELRSLVGTLRDNPAADFAPQAGLRDLEQLVERAGPHVQLEQSGEIEELPVALQAGLYRIAQESLTNALRHASDATRIQLRVNASASEVTLSVEDDGKPLASTHTPGFGLLGMRERATLLGGTLHAGRKSEGGFKVEAVLPRKAEAR